MIDDVVARPTLLGALELACRAPSVHNSQPWRWEVAEQRISLHADRRRWLRSTDPDGRDLVLSCGAALHHLVVALAALGVRGRVHRLPDADEPDHLATIDLTRGRGTRDEITRASSLGLRRDDRRPFLVRPVPEEVVTALRAAAEGQGALLRFLRRGGDRSRLFAQVRAAGLAQAATAGFAGELAGWTQDVGNPPVRGRSTARRPVPGALATVSDLDGAELFVIGTSSDDRLSQLRAGEALSAVLLTATGAGLATGTETRVMEVPATRRALRDSVLEGSLEPQVVVRVGWAGGGPPLARTRRRPLAEVVAAA